MRRNKTLRIFTLAFFCLLILGFIAFKTGAVDRYFNQAEVVNGERKDSISLGEIDSILSNPTMLSTSKSVIAIDQKIKFPAKAKAGKDSLAATPKK